MYGNAASYRVRPLGPEKCLFEIWSLTMFPEGEEPNERLSTPIPMAPDDPRWPTIPSQDFSNLPRQQLGLRSKGFESMHLSREIEGMILNYQRLIDGYLGRLGYDNTAGGSAGVWPHRRPRKRSGLLASPLFRVG